MNSLSFLLPRPTAELMPEQIEARIGALIRECLKRPSLLMANAIVHQISILCAHPDYHGSWEERCAYRRLAQHWRCLAWLTAERMQTLTQLSPLG